MSRLPGKARRLWPPNLICAALLALGVLAPAALWPQEPEATAPNKAASSADIFSGTVTKLTPDSISVVRKVPGHDAVTRDFMRNARTKVEGKLRERARVTVHFKAAEDGGLVALYIIVR